jgi:aspartate kinase
MAASGARVLQLRSVEFARNHDVVLHVRSTFSDTGGTKIRREEPAVLEKAIISGVTHTTEETLYRVGGASTGVLFTALAAASVNVDTILQSEPTEIVFSAPETDHATTARVLDELGVSWSARTDLGRVSLVGAGMKSHPGVAARVFSTLAGLGIETEVVNTSEIKVACHVPRSDIPRAVQALHDAFELGSPSDA